MKKILFYSLVILISSCINDTGLSVSKQQNLLVLNGILQPDSLISITLSKNISLLDKEEYPFIDDGQVFLYENDQFLGKLDYEDSGRYIFNYRPHMGYKYSIKAFVIGYDTLSAEDIIPNNASATVLFHPGRRKYSNSLTMELNINDLEPHQNYYWVSLIKTDYAECETVYLNGKSEIVYDSTNVTTELLQAIESNSLIVDHFNGWFDNLDGIYSYDYYFRIEDQSFNRGKGSVEFSTSTQFCKYYSMKSFIELDDKQGLFVNLINASVHYDRYMKSSVQYYLNHQTFTNGDDESDPNPFAEPNKIYSNIKGGVGIFAAYNSTLIKVK